MSPDAAPIVAAQTLLAAGLGDDTVLARISVAWRLDRAHALEALAAARALLDGADPPPARGQVA